MGSTKCCGPIAYQLHVHDIQSCMVRIRFGLGPLAVDRKEHYNFVSLGSEIVEMEVEDVMF